MIQGLGMEQSRVSQHNLMSRCSDLSCWIQGEVELNVENAVTDLVESMLKWILVYIIPIQLHLQILEI